MHIYILLYTMYVCRLYFPLISLRNHTSKINNIKSKNQELKLDKLELVGPETDNTKGGPVTLGNRTVMINGSQENVSRGCVWLTIQSLAFRRFKKIAKKRQNDSERVGLAQKLGQIWTKQGQLPLYSLSV